MTDEDPAVEDAVSDEPLTDPAPATGEHPGGPRADESPFPAIAAEMAEHLGGDPTGHDMHHVWRVFRLGLRLLDAEGGDPTVVGAAALTHDLHRVRGDGTGVDPDETLDEIEEILRSAGVSEETIAPVEHCVSVHDEYAFRGDDPTPETLEAAILRDADNLDAMGAVGVARTFAFGGAHETPMWDPEGAAYSQLYHLSPAYRPIISR